MAKKIWSPQRPDEGRAVHAIGALIQQALATACGAWAAFAPSGVQRLTINVSHGEAPGGGPEGPKSLSEVPGTFPQRSREGPGGARKGRQNLRIRGIRIINAGAAKLPSGPSPPHTNAKFQLRLMFEGLNGLAKQIPWGQEGDQ